MMKFGAVKIEKLWSEAKAIIVKYGKKQKNDYFALNIELKHNTPPEIKDRWEVIKKTISELMKVQREKEQLKTEKKAERDKELEAAKFDREAKKIASACKKIWI